MMVLSVTSSKSNSPWIATTATSGEHVFREKSLQLTGLSSLTTRASYGTTANAPANPTIASQFIVLHGSTKGAEDTSGLGSSFDISSLGEATETHIRTKNGPSGLFWRIWVYPDVQPISEIESTTVIISSKAATVEMPAVLMDENLSAEDREAREKGLALAAYIEHLYRTDVGFRRWYHEGIDEIEAGYFVTFSEDGWKEE